MIDNKTKAKVVRFIRLLFRQSPQFQEALKRSVHPTIKGPRGGKMYACACCGEAFSAKEIQVDHIDSVVPKGIKQKDMTIDEYVERLFCSVENLQILSKDCHIIKSKKENEK